MRTTIYLRRIDGVRKTINIGLLFFEIRIYNESFTFNKANAVGPPPPAVFFHGTLGRSHPPSRKLFCPRSSSPSYIAYQFSYPRAGGGRAPQSIENQFASVSIEFCVKESLFHQESTAAESSEIDTSPYACI